MAVDNVHPNQLLAVDNIHPQEAKKSLNNRRRRRGSRRRSSAVAEITTEDDDDDDDVATNVAQPSAESDPFFMTVHSNKNSNNRHRRKSSHTVGKSKQNHKHKASIPNEEEDGSPAFQSLVDIISEMKRLPSISITTDNTTLDESSAIVNQEQNPWRRVRRHSEPPQKMKHQQFDHHNNKKNDTSLKTINEQKLGEPVFSNSFLPLEEEEAATDGENIEVPVSPLNNGEEHMALPPPTKRTRSQSGI